MSLLQRVEAAKHGTGAHETHLTVTGPSHPVPAEPAEVTSSTPAPRTSPAPTARLSAREETFRDIRRRLEAEVVNALSSRLDLTNPSRVRDDLAGVVDEFVGDFVKDHNLSLTKDERQRLVDGVIHDAAGFGPIEPYLADRQVTEVMVNGPHQVYVERAGRIEKVDAIFRDDEHVLNIIDRIITPLGRHIDETSPRVDARLPDGSRVNAIIKPLSLVGPVITVRKFGTRFTVEDLVRFGTATPEMFEFMRACVEAKLNVFLSGGTGSGKTTTLNVLSSFIPDDERIITIEDSAELQLTQEHVVTLEARPSNLEGQGEITIRDLLRNALHMRPDRIVVGECRAGEALDMIQAMTTGQDGSLSTGHANTPARHAPPPRDDDPHDRLRAAAAGHPRADRLGHRRHRPHRPPARRLAQDHQHHRGLRHRGRRRPDPGDLHLRSDRCAGREDRGRPEADRHPAHLHGRLPQPRHPPADRRVRHPARTTPPSRSAPGKARWGIGGAARKSAPSRSSVGRGRAYTVGGMAFVSAVGPVDPETGELRSIDIREQTRQCLENVSRWLAALDSSIDRVVWANWSLREPSEFDTFYEEWLRWFDGEAPVGQGTLMSPVHRRAGFRVSVGVIAATRESDMLEAPMAALPLIEASRLDAASGRMHDVPGLGGPDPDGTADEGTRAVTAG